MTFLPLMWCCIAPDFCLQCLCTIKQVMQRLGGHAPQDPEAREWNWGGEGEVGGGGGGAG